MPTADKELTKRFHWMLQSIKGASGAPSSAASASCGLLFDFSFAGEPQTGIPQTRLAGSEFK